LNIQDPINFADLNHSEEAIEKAVHTNLQEILVSDLQGQREPKDEILQLQNELFTNLDEEIYANMNLSSGNNLHTEYIYDALSGEFERIISSNLVEGSKDISLSSGHHQLGTSKNIKKVIRGNFDKNVGSGKIDLAKFEDVAQVFSKSSESGSLSLFDGQSAKENMQTIKNLHAMLNLTKASGEGDQGKAASSNLLNDFWNSLPKQVTFIQA